MSAIAERKPVRALVCAVALLAGGGWAASRISLEWVPALETSTLSVAATWPGASARSVERHVAAPLEAAFQRIPGIQQVESSSRNGQAYLRLRLAKSRDLAHVVAEISDRLALLHHALPEHVTPHIIHDLPDWLKDAQDFIVLQVTGRESSELLRQLVERVIVPHFRRLDGISGISIEGGGELELLIAARADRLQLHQLSVESLKQGLDEALGSRSYGLFHGRHGGGSLVLKSGQEDLVSLEQLALQKTSDSGGLVRLGDVADISLGSPPLRSISRVDGKPVLTLHLDRAPGTHLLAVAADVRRAVKELHHELPPGIELLVADDRSEDVKKELRDLALRIGLGLLGIFAILFAMLRCWRAVGIVFFTVAVAVIAGLALMQPLGLTFNILTLAGLALLLSLLMGNAAVLVERLLAERSRGPFRAGGATAAARRALRAVWLPLLGGAMATSAVFLPMVYLSGELRSLFIPFAALCAFTLLFSLASAVLLVPLLGQYLPEPSVDGQRGPWIGHTARRLFLLPFRLVSRYRKTTLVLLSVAVGLPTPLVPDYKEEPDAGWASAEEERAAARYNATVGNDSIRSLRQWLDPLLGGVTRPFLNEVELGEGWNFEERPQITVWIELPLGSGIERTDERIRPFEERALRAEKVKRTLTWVYEDVAMLRVLFEDGALDSPEPFALREELVAQALQVAGMQISISGLMSMGFYSGLGDASGLEVEAYGPSYERLEEVAEEFARRVGRDPRVAAVDTNAHPTHEMTGREVLRLRWEADAVAQTDVRTRELAGLLRAHLFARTPALHTRLEGKPHLAVRLVMAGAEDLELSNLLNLPFNRGGETSLRLADLTELTVEREPPRIDRKGQQYRRHIQVYYRGLYSMGKERIDREIRALRLPPGYRLERPTYSAINDETRRELVWLILGTLALVTAVIAAVLESWRLAGLVMLAVPLAWIGVALGFLWSGEPFGEGAFFGIVLTIGIAVNGCILFADRFRIMSQRHPRTSPSRLALLAIRSRLRPIWIMTLTAVVGMLPLILLPGAESFLVGLTITVMGGLASSTLLAPVAMAALLSWPSRRSASSPTRARTDLKKNSKENSATP